MEKSNIQLNFFTAKEWASLQASPKHCFFDGRPISLLTHGKKGLCEEHIYGFLEDLTLLQWTALFNPGSYPTANYLKTP
jgi:hypothetical protein